MYRDLSDKQWQSWWKIDPKDKPDVLILWGIFKSIAEEGFWSVPDFLMYQFKPHLKKIRRLSLPHTFIGEYKGLNIAVTHAYGGAFSLDQTIQLTKLGAKLVILIGHFGGLQDGLKVGQIFIPSAAFRSDGASFHLLGKEDRFVYPSQDMEVWLKSYLEKKKIPYVTGVVKTASTMVGQNAEMINEWKRGGFVGVDLESGVVFSAAKKFGFKSISIMHHSDHVGGGKLLSHTTKPQKEAKKKARKLLVDLALRVADEFGRETDPA
jgi:purine-nucleoside phosphorylase